MSVKIFYDKINFRLRGWKKVRTLIEKVISEKGYISDDLNFIITNDDNLRNINIEFLKSEYFTDVISFNYNEKNLIKGEIYLSIETIKRNAHNYKVSLKMEVMRVMIHGVLHLCGYDDKKRKEKILMKKMEEKWLKILTGSINGIQV